MSKPVYLNDVEIYNDYKARLVSYSIGPVSISNAYQEFKASVIPVKLNESIGTRTITLELEFEGDTHNEAILNISNLTAALLDANDIELPDGFTYFCILDKPPTPANKGGMFYRATFKLVGYRHGKKQTHVFTETGSIFAFGNCNAPAIITIEGTSGSVTVNDITVNNITAKVVINGYEKTVKEIDGVTESNKFKDCEMTKFPSLNPGTNIIDITGEATVTIEYTPIYM